MPIRRRALRALGFAGLAVATVAWAALTTPLPPRAEPPPAATAGVTPPPALPANSLPEESRDGAAPLQPAARRLLPAVPATDTASQPTAPLTVPFAAQAPFGEWDDPRQQDGCEEASLVMAWHWLEGRRALGKTQAREEILALSTWSEEHLGEWRSTSAADTARLFRERYGYDDVDVASDITVADVQRAVEAGNLVIVPTDGTKLGNPYYRPPGPPEHMLVVLGYDASRDEFITNDPGTRHGAGYRYGAAVLAGALRDYPTGHREPNAEPHTAMIVVEPRPR